MSGENVALVYARALFAIAEAEGTVEEMNEEVAVLQRLIGTDPLVRAFFESPRIDRSEKAEVIGRTLEGKLSGTLLNFLRVVVKKGRQAFLRGMLAEFRELRNKWAGIVHATAISAVPLSEATRAGLLGALERELQKKIELENVVREDIVGGIVVRFDGMVADGSISTALRKIRERMLTPKFGSEYVHEDQR